MHLKSTCFSCILKHAAISVYSPGVLSHRCDIFFLQNDKIYIKDKTLIDYIKYIRVLKAYYTLLLKTL